MRSPDCLMWMSRQATLRVVGSKSTSSISYYAQLSYPYPHKRAHCSSLLVRQMLSRRGSLQAGNAHPVHTSRNGFDTPKTVVSFKRKCSKSNGCQVVSGSTTEISGDQMVFGTKKGKPVSMRRSGRRESIGWGCTGPRLERARRAEDDAVVLHALDVVALLVLRSDLLPLALVLQSRPLRT